VSDQFIYGMIKSIDFSPSDLTCVLGITGLPKSNIKVHFVECLNTIFTQRRGVFGKIIDVFSINKIKNNIIRINPVKNRVVEYSRKAAYGV
jgi:hypothetical protein